MEYFGKHSFTLDDNILDTLLLGFGCALVLCAFALFPQFGEDERLDG